MSPLKKARSLLSAHLFRSCRRPPTTLRCSRLRKPNCARLGGSRHQHLRSQQDVEPFVWCVRRPPRQVAKIGSRDTHHIDCLGRSVESCYERCRGILCRARRNERADGADSDDPARLRPVPAPLRIIPALSQGERVPTPSAFIRALPYRCWNLRRSLELLRLADADGVVEAPRRGGRAGRSGTPSGTPRLSGRSGRSGTPADDNRFKGNAASIVVGKAPPADADANITHPLGVRHRCVPSPSTTIASFI